MKTTFALLWILGAISSQASVSFDILAGELKNNDGTKKLADGSLLLLIASGADNLFSNELAEGQYVSADDVILAAFESNGNIYGATSAFFTPELSESPVGQSLALRWFVGISFQQFQASPETGLTKAGDHFGTFAGPVESTNGGDQWIFPTDDPASGHMLRFVTATLNDNFGNLLTDAHPDALGVASFAVVPEPRSCALCGLALLLLTARRKNEVKSNFLAALG